MNIKEIIQQIRNQINPKDNLTDEVVLGFLRVLEGVNTEEIPCNEVYARLDEYVEHEVHGKDAALIMPLVREHLDVCSECCDEYEALLDVLEETSKE